MAALTCSSCRLGKSSKISWTLAPSARLSRTIRSGTRVPTALAYADALTRSDPEFQKRHAGAREHFTEVEIAEIAAIVINMNVWTRVKLAQGATPQYK